MFRSFVTIICFVILSSSWGQVMLVPTNTQATLWPISILGSSIVVGGVDNYLVKSYDECNTLIPLTVPGPGNYLNYLERLSTSHAYMLSTNFGAYNNQVFESTDDGQSWSKKLDTNGLLITHLRFFDDNEGIALSTFNKLLRTKDGGTTWLSGSHPNTIATCIKTFGDSLVGVGDGLGTFVLSKDRGVTWFGGGNFGTQAGPNDFFFINKDTIFVIATLGIYYKNFARSYNGGASWTYSQIAPGYTYPYAVYAKSSREIYIAAATSGTIGVILKSVDEGLSWSTFNTGIKSSLTDIKFLNDSIALVCGSNGVLFKLNTKTAPFSPITGVKSFINDFAIDIYPNPLENVLHFQTDITFLNKYQITIFNVFGQEVFSKSNADLKNDIDISFLSSGLYYLKISNEVNSKKIKMIKN